MAIYLFVTGVLALLTWQTVTRLSAEGHSGVAVVVAGVVVYAVILFWLHPILFGANPLA